MHSKTVSLRTIGHLHYEGHHVFRLKYLVIIVRLNYLDVIVWLKYLVTILWLKYLAAIVRLKYLVVNVRHSGCMLRDEQKCCRQYDQHYDHMHNHKLYLFHKFSLP